MSLVKLIAEAIRLEVLLALIEDSDQRLSDLILRRWIRLRVDHVDEPQLRAHLDWLMRSGLVTLEKPEVGPWIVRLTELGEAVGKGRVFEGVARPDRA